MSQPEGRPRSRRKYVVRACNGCRRRRSKCDGVRPVCGTCSSTGHECSWSSDNDDARPATKQYIESLRVKARVLELEVMRLRQASPQALDPSIPGSSLSAPVIFPSDPLTNSTGELQDLLHGSPSTNARGSQLPPKIPYPLSTTLDGPEPPQSSPHSGATVLSTQYPPITIVPWAESAPMYQYIFNIDMAIPVEQQTPEVQASLVCRWSHYLPALGVIHLSRTEHDTIISRCFSYGASWLSGLIPELFLRDMVQYLAPTTTEPRAKPLHYTPMLHCSLLAFSAAFSDDVTIRALTTRNLFAIHAKQWLDEEFRDWSPSFSLSLSLLSEYHCGIGQHNTGYMYMGMGVRMARALTDPLITPPDSREWYHWSIFVQEKIMAIDKKGRGNMPIPKLPIGVPLSVELGGRLHPASSATKMFEDKQYSKFVIEGFIQSCKLMIIASRMIDDPIQSNSAVVDLHVQLDSWFNDLPDALLIRQRSALTIPHVLSLHVCYWWLILHLHLPVAERAQRLEPEPSADLSVKMCERATDKLVQLFSSFDKQFGYSRFPRNMIRAIHTCGCALVLEQSMAPAGAVKKQSTAKEGVDVCFHALLAINETWPCAGTLAEELEARAGGVTVASTSKLGQTKHPNRIQE